MIAKRRASSVGLLGVFVCLFLSSPAFADSCRTSSTTTTVEWDTWRLSRRVALLSAAGGIANRAADRVLDVVACAERRRSWQAVTIRLGRLYLVNFPIAALVAFGAHEQGHLGRARDLGITGRVEVTRWPWPLPYAGGLSLIDEPPLDPSDKTTRLSLIAGGEEGTRILADRTAERIYSTDSVNYFDWLVLVYSKLDHPTYALSDLRPRYFKSFATYGGPDNSPGDFREYSLQFAALEGAATIEDVGRTARSLRLDSLLNLLDATLWFGIGQIGSYLLTGQSGGRAPAIPIGGVRVVPAAFGSLTPLGPQRGASVMIVGERRLVKAEVGAIGMADHQRLWSIRMSAITYDRTGRMAPRVRIDVWQRPERGLGVGVGAGLSDTAQIAGHSSEWEAEVRLKTAGYLFDAPPEAGFSLRAGMKFRF